MFEPQHTTRWYRSSTTLLFLSILLPPIGLVLLCLQAKPLRWKVTRSVGVLLLVAGYFSLFSLYRRSGRNEAHYAELEAHRAQQQREAQTQAQSVQGPASATSPQQTATGVQSSPNTPSTSTEEAAHASKNYWTSFRGPNRDGRYDEMPVLTKWSAQGPAPGLERTGWGWYASVTIADGRVTQSSNDAVRKWWPHMMLILAASCGLRAGMLSTQMKLVMVHERHQPGTMAGCMHWAQRVNCVVSMQNRRSALGQEYTKRQSG